MTRDNVNKKLLMELYTAGCMSPGLFNQLMNQEPIKDRLDERGYLDEGEYSDGK